MEGIEIEKKEKVVRHFHFTPEEAEWIKAEAERKDLSQVRLMRRLVKREMSRTSRALNSDNSSGISLPTGAESTPLANSSQGTGTVQFGTSSAQ